MQIFLFFACGILLASLSLSSYESFYQRHNANVREKRQFAEFIVKNGSKFSTMEEALMAFTEKRAKERYEKLLKDIEKHEKLLKNNESKNQ